MPPASPAKLSLRVHPLPPGPESAARALAPPAIAIVIDLLRASTTIAAALANGAARIVPVMTVDDALARRTPGILLGGERRGLAPEGFDLGNSPRDYTRERVGGKTIVFTTTNGTRAIHAASGAAAVLVGALVNLDATAARAARLATDLASRSPEAPPSIHIICAGTNAEETEEDILCAGAFVDRLAPYGAPHEDDRETADALAAWRAASATPDSLLDALRASRGGRNLIALELARDITDAAKLNAHPTVAHYDPASEAITADR